MSAVVRKTVTVVFADIAGSTGLAEQIDAEAVREVLDRYFAEMRRILERHGATIEKFIGDAVVAVFGVPTLHESDALRAVRAAADMWTALGELNKRLEVDAGVRLETRVGINTGEAVVGDPSTGQAFVTGDCVNVAARLQQNAGLGEVWLGDTTYELVRDRIHAESINPLALKGKTEKVRAWRLIGLRSASDRAGMPGDGRLIGRGAELDQLSSWLHATVSNRECRLVTGIGPPGIGKSRLANEFLNRLGDQCLVLRAHCPEYGEGITYAPIAEVIGLLGGIDQAAARVANADERELVRRHVGRAIGSEFGDSSTAQIFSAIRKLFQVIARQRPIVLLLDDVHWAESTLLDVLEYLVETGIDGPMLLLALARPELVDTRPRWTELTSKTRVLFVDPLNEADSLTLLAGHETNHLLDPVQRTRIMEAAAGNPLFLEQMLAMIREDPSVDEVPPSVQALIAARLERLDPSERAIVEVAAVEGERFHSSAVGALLPGAEMSDFDSHLVALTRKQMVRAEGGRPPGQEVFRFVHVIVRDVAYEAISKARRAELHEHLAKLLESQGEAAELAGFHLEKASKYLNDLRRRSRADEVGSRARDHLATAGSRAFGRGDMAAATNLLERAEALPGQQTSRRGEAQLMLGSAFARSGNFARCEEVLNRVITEASQAADRSLESRALIERSAWRLWQQPATAREAHRIAADAVRYFTQIHDDRGLAQAWRLLADAEPTWQASFDALERAVAHGRAAEDHREVSDALWWSGVALHFGPTHTAEAIEWCQQVLSRVEDDRTLEAGTRGVLAGLVAMQGRFDEARVLYATGFAILGELGLELRMATRRTISGAIELLAGDPIAAERELRWAIERLNEMGEGIDRPGIASQLAEALYQQGRYGEAETFAKMSEQGVHDARLRYQFAVRAKLLARRGEFAAAEQAARKVVAAASVDDNLNMRGHALMDLADVLRAGGKAEEARLHLQSAIRLYEEKGNIVSAAAAKALLALPPPGSDTVIDTLTKDSP